MKLLRAIATLAIIALCWVWVMVSCSPAPRAVLVREEKSDAEMKRLLRGKPITRQEIANRWKP